MKHLLASLFFVTISVSTFAQTGKFWGSTYGGNGNGGFIYRFSPDNPAGELMHTFPLSDIDGSNPTVALLVAGDGYLYGVTNSGGQYSYGVLYRISQSTLEFEKLPSHSKVSFMDLTGKVIESRSIFPDTPEHFNLAPFSNGIYIFRIEMENSVVIKRISRI